MYFDVPLFNNYSGILSGRKKSSKIILGKLQEVILLSGIRMDYEITEVPLGWLPASLRLSAKVPRRLRKPLVKIAKWIMRVKF
jgi:hypothetical protein